MERKDDEKGVRAPYGVYHTANTPKCEQELCLKYSGCIWCNIPQGSTNRCFRKKEKKKENKYPVVTQYKAYMKEADRPSGYQHWPETQLERVSGVKCGDAGGLEKGKFASKQSLGFSLCQCQTHLSSSKAHARNS